MLTVYPKNRSCLKIRISNKEVLNKLHLVLNKAEGHDITWEQFQVDKSLAEESMKTAQFIGDVISDRHITMIGHILRRDCEDLIWKVTVDAHLQRATRGFRRVGLSRMNWTEDTQVQCKLQKGAILASSRLCRSKFLWVLKLCTESIRSWSVWLVWQWCIFRLSVPPAFVSRLLAKGPRKSTTWAMLFSNVLN